MSAQPVRSAHARTLDRIVAPLSSQGLGMAVVVFVIGFLAAVLIPDFMEMQRRAQRAEVPGNVDGLKTLQLSYASKSGNFLPCGDRETALTRAGKDAREFGSVDAGDCWEQLGFRPDGTVRGGYWVEVGTDEAGSPGFVVHGLSDVDGDGVYAEYTATVLKNATLVTPEGQY